MLDYTLPLDQLPDPLPIAPLEEPFDVTITPPGSKSITNRAYVLAALAEGESRIIRPLRSDDCDGLLDALCTLGVTATWDGDDVLIQGVNGRFPKGGHINLGDGGTPTRFMIACACLAAEPVIVDGSARMRERPIAEGVDMLRQLGATIEYIEADGRLPVRVIPSDNFKGGKLTVSKTASSQFISAVMLIGPRLTGGVNLEFPRRITSESYVRLTCGILQDWGLGVSCSADASDSGRMLDITICTDQISSANYAIDPDASSAIYWQIASALVPESSMTLPQYSDNVAQPDGFLCHAVEACGARLQYVTHDQMRTCRVSHGGLWKAIGSYHLSGSPDGAVCLGASLAVADGSSTLTGLHTLRVKETDRLAALAAELRKIGCTISTTDDSITIDPSTRHNDPVVIETYNDHRMAMAFAILGLARSNISIANPKCVAKSYPGFWRDFATLYA